MSLSEISQIKNFWDILNVIFEKCCREKLVLKINDVVDSVSELRKISEECFQITNEIVGITQLFNDFANSYTDFLTSVDKINEYANRFFQGDLTGKWDVFYNICMNVDTDEDKINESNIKELSECIRKNLEIDPCVSEGQEETVLSDYIVNLVKKLKLFKEKSAKATEMSKRLEQINSKLVNEKIPDILNEYKRITNNVKELAKDLNLPLIDELLNDYLKEILCLINDISVKNQYDDSNTFSSISNICLKICAIIGDQNSLKVIYNRDLNLISQERDNYSKKICLNAYKGDFQLVDYLIFAPEHIMNRNFNQSSVDKIKALKDEIKNHTFYVAIPAIAIGIASSCVIGSLFLVFKDHVKHPMFVLSAISVLASAVISVCLVSKHIKNQKYEKLGDLVVNLLIGGPNSSLLSNESLIESVEITRRHSI